MTCRGRASGNWCANRIAPNGFSTHFPNFGFDFVSGSAYDGSLRGTTQMKNDSELLRSYVYGNSGGAFAEIVRRNVALVHSCILRRVGGDSQLAEDITQKVFCDLARKAPALSKISSVSGWLYVSATLASAEIVRKERRRKARDFEASRIHAILAPDGTPTSDAWNCVSDLIDELICGLKPSEREAVVLRFFSRRTYPEIAGIQSTTEDGARKRVGRALEKLRLRLGRSGVNSSLEALEAVLEKQPETAPPNTLADRVAGIAIAEFGATSAATPWLFSLFRVLTSKTATLGAVFVAAVVLIAWQHRRNALLLERMERLHGQREEVRRLEGDNRLLTRRINLADDLRRTLANISNPSHRPTGGPGTGNPVGAPLNVQVTSEGQIRWENERVDLEGFLNRLVAFHAQDPGSEAQFVVNGAPGAAFSATAYVVEQASKAGFRDIVINSQALPEATDNWVSIARSPDAVGDNAPPTLPDLAVKP